MNCADWVTNPLDGGYYAEWIMYIVITGFLLKLVIDYMAYSYAPNVIQGFIDIWMFV